MMANKQLAQDFFMTHLPPTILEQVDIDTIKLESAHFIDNQHDSDLVFSTPLKNQNAAFFYLMEHQSSEDPLIAFRVFYDIMQLLKRHILYDKVKVLPFIYAIIGYNGYTPYTRYLLPVREIGGLSPTCVSKTHHLNRCESTFG